MSLAKCFSMQSNERILSLNVTLLTYAGQIISNQEGQQYTPTVGYFIILS